MHKLRYIILMLLFFNSYSCASNANDSSYPKTREEESRERIGSILGEGGISLKFSKNNNQHSIGSKNSKNDELNKDALLKRKYLWQAIIKTLNYAPIAVIDPENGIFITEWFSKEDKKNISQKIIVLIKDNSSPLESIDVMLQQKIKNKNRWVEKQSQQNEIDEIKQEIISCVIKEKETEEK